MADAARWIQRSIDEAVQLFHLVVTVAVVVARRTPIATVRLEDDVRRPRSAQGLFAELGELESATGVVPVTIVVVVALWLLLVVSVLLAVVRPDQPEPAVRRVARVVLWVAAPVLVLGALLLIPLLNAVDHVEAAQFDPPFLVQAAGIATLLLPAVVAWRVRDV